MTLPTALSLAAQGFHLFPCLPGGKKPAISHWPAKATRDPEQIRTWAAKHLGCNWGIFTGKFGDDHALLVVDVDVKADKNGNHAILAHELAGRDFPLTLENTTPTGGRHLVYLVDAPVKQGVDILGVGLDIRSHGGYIVAPGSLVEAGEYFTDRPAAPAAAPRWIIEACGAPRAKATDRQRLPGVDPARAEKRAIAYLTTDAPEAIEGAGGDHTTFVVAAKLKDLGVDPSTAVELMLEHWSAGCGWSPEDLATKVRNAFAYGTNPPGADAPEAVFKPVEVHGTENGAHPLEAVNVSWSIVAEAPRVVAYRERRDGTTGQTVFEAFRKLGFMDLHADRMFEGKPLAQAWWGWSGRRIYPGGVEFAPLVNLPDDTLNLWGGFAVQAAPGNWSLMKDHICDVICAGDPTLNEYVLNWLARLIQQPGEPGHVALVLRGNRGAGKGTLGEALLDLVGVHGIHLNDPKQLTGQFTGHLAGKVFVFSDEAVFAGDRGSTPRLKAMITERRVPMERKGLDIVQVRNCAHVLMASNDDWVVPAGPLERRFCVMDVSGHRVDDVPYFGAIRKQMGEGGREAMLFDLQSRDISGFEVWDFPHTDAEIDQQLASLDGKNGWLHDALSRGWVAGKEWSENGALVPKAAVYDDYVRHCQAQREWRAEKNAAFWKHLRKVLDRAGASVRSSQVHAGERLAGLPPLSEARKAFGLELGRTLCWGDD